MGGKKKFYKFNNYLQIFMSESSNHFATMMQNLDFYKSQLNGIDTSFPDYHNGVNDLETQKNIEEIINLTEDLINSILKNRINSSESDVLSIVNKQSELIYEPPKLDISTLPPEVDQQIRDRQASQSILGHAPAWCAIGQTVEARWPQDGHFYCAKIIAATKDFYFLVEYLTFKEQELLKKDDVHKTQNRSIECYKPTQPPKKWKMDEIFSMSKEIPIKFVVKEGDNERMITKKRKLIKKFKKQKRFSEIDSNQKRKVDSWKMFFYGKENRILSL